MTAVRCSIALLFVLLTARPTVLAAQDGLVIARCRVGADAVCAGTSLATGGAAGRLQMLVGSDTLYPTSDARRAASQSASLLVLVDVSGSMKGAGLVNVRPALRSFLATLDAKRVAVAVAPFGSRAVIRGVQSVSFGTPSAAATVLGALPQPTGNTGLYTAVAAAAARARADANRRGSARAVVLVVTDGVNDVRPGDDPELLRGSDGLRRAREFVESQGVTLFAVGAGASVRRAELDALAGASHTTIAAMDAVALSRTLGEVADEIAGAGGGSFVLPDRVWHSQARGPMSIRLVAGDRDVARGRVTPPLLALPATRGVLAGGEAARLAMPYRRMRLTALAAFIVIAFTMALLWAQAVPGGGVVQRRRSRARGILRDGLREAPPRPRDAKTADPADRIVRTGAA